VTTIQWYTLFHLIGAFAMAGGAVAALAAAVTSREGYAGGAPARTQAWAVRMLVLPGAVLALIFGMLLVDEAGYEYGDSWVSAALVLWIALALIAEGVVGRNARAETPTRRRALYGSAALVLLTVVILILMVWRPGS
jgi:chromate transport protein ChrA